jgi:hypothetical protein
MSYREILAKNFMDGQELISKAGMESKQFGIWKFCREIEQTIK